VKFGLEERTYSPLFSAKFHIDRCNLSPLQGEKLKNRPVSKNNTDRAALTLRAVLSVMKLLRGIDPGTRNNRLDFGCDVDSTSAYFSFSPICNI